MAANENTTAPIKSQAASYDIAKSDETLDLAKDLAKFIKENKLSTQVQGKEFVNVEGWQYAGSRLGIVPIVEHVINCSTEQELKYQAKVTLFDMRSQHTVGAGFAICSNKESGRKFYQEFAIASMAQTRAIGKAYRNILAWIIRAAGYEPTPAEEMEYTGNVPAAAPVAAGPAPVMRAVSNTPEPVEVVYASAEQKAEIIRLLNHPLITRQEKTKMLLNINRLDPERADVAITKLNRAIEDRGGNLAEATLGNEPAGETPAAQPSADLAVSTTSDQSHELEAARIERVSAGFAKANEEFGAHVAKHRATPAPVAAADQSIAGPAEIPAEVLDKLTRQMEACASGIDLENLWKALTKNEKKALAAAKETAKARLKNAAELVARSVGQQNGVTMKDAGNDTSLVDTFCDQPLSQDTQPVVYATAEQKEAIKRLLDHPKITRKEKTRLLISVNKLDKERARQALLALRKAIGEREGINPIDGARAAVKAFVLRHQGQLSVAQADELNALAVSPEATLEFLLDAVDLAQAALLADAENGVAGDLDTETARIAA